MFWSLAGAVSHQWDLLMCQLRTAEPRGVGGCFVHQSILRPNEGGGAGGVFADGVAINKDALLDIFIATGAVRQILFCCISFKCLTLCTVIITATISQPNWLHSHYRSHSTEIIHNQQ